MTTSAKIAIPITILVPVCLALGGWQWNLQGTVTETKTRVDYLQDDLKEIKYMINRNYLMNRGLLDTIQDDVQDIKTNVKTKRK